MPGSMLVVTRVTFSPPRAPTGLEAVLGRSLTIVRPISRYFADLFMMRPSAARGELERHDRS